MRSILRPATTLALLLASAVTAHAGSTVLYTAPTFMPGSSTLMFCYANNLDSKDRDLTVEVVNTAGTAVATSSGPVSPGQTRGVQTNNLFASYCRITFSGSRKNVRGAMTLGANGIPFVPQVTLEAR
jgi:hypothetical protein